MKYMAHADNESGCTQVTNHTMRYLTIYHSNGYT